MRMNVSRSIIVVLCILGIGSSTRPRTQQIARDQGDALVLDFEDLKYPPLARFAHLQGAAVVQVKLSDEGTVTNAVAISGAEPLALAAVDNVRKWHFRPNARKSAVIVYNFTIIDGRCNSDATLFVLRQMNLATVIACPPSPNPSASQSN